MNKTVALFFIYILVSVCTWGQTWNGVGAGLGNNSAQGAYAITVDENVLYAGGNYAVSGSMEVNGIARFNTSNWDSLGAGLGGNCLAIAIYNNELYAAGGFNAAGPFPGIPNTNHIARWDGMQWSSAGALSSDNISNIYALAVYNGELYAGGAFAEIGGSPASRIAKWNGTSWSPLGSGVTGGVTSVKALAVYKGELYVGGIFTNAGGIPVSNIARWNGSQWDSLSSGVYNAVASMLVDTVNNLLYVGGGLVVAGGVPVSGIAQWDSTAWSSPGGGIPRSVFAMAMHEGELYTGSSSTTLSVTDSVIFKWNGSVWNPVTPGPNGWVHSLNVYNGNLYVGGDFSMAGTVSANGIACYGNSCPQGVGIKYPVAEKNLFRVYPNPAKSELTIEVNIPLKGNHAKLVFYDKMGREVKSLAFTPGKPPIKTAISGLAKGLCIIALVNEQGEKLHTEKVVIE